MFRSILMCMAVCAGHATVQAQTTRPPLQEGDRVRISADGLKGTFIVAGLSADTLAVQDAAVAEPSASETVLLPLGSIRKLDVSRGQRSSGAGALRGAGIGLAIGAGTGALFGIASGDDPPDFVSFSAEEKALVLGALLGATGALVGGIAGASSPGEVWAPVPLQPRVSVSGAGTHRLALSCSLRI